MKKRPRKTIQGPVRPSGVPALAVSLPGLIVGCLVIYFHGLNSIFNGYYHSNKLLYDKITPDTIEMLNRFSGTGIILLALAYLLYATLFKQKTDDFLKSRYKPALLFLLSLIGTLVFYAALLKYFHNDEIEHIHSAWYVKNSFVPYRDFFQHHNPLLWYLILPFLYLFGDTLTTLLAARFFMVFVLLGIACLTYLISAAISRSRETGLIAVVLLFSSITFPEKAIEIRPDVPEIFFGLLSMYLLIRFFSDRHDKYLFFSGLSAAVSFLFLQKTIFLLLSYVIIFSYGCIKKEFSARNAGVFAGGFFLPLLIFIICLLLGGALHDYYITNIMVNFHHFGSNELSFRLLNPLWYFIKRRFWLLLIGAVPVILLFRDKRSPAELKTLFLIGLVELFSLGLYAHTYKHFFLFAIIIFCIIGAQYLARLLDYFKTTEANRLALFTLLLSSAVPFLIINSLHSHGPQFEKMQYVLNITKDSDLVHDGANTFNLFRRDLHYFWFQLGVGLKSYNEATGNKYGDYDACSLIRAKRPKIISGIKVDSDQCRLWTLYDPTQFKYTYIRRDDPPGSSGKRFTGTGEAAPAGSER